MKEGGLNSKLKKSDTGENSNGNCKFRSILCALYLQFKRNKKYGAVCTLYLYKLNFLN